MTKKIVSGLLFAVEAILLGVTVFQVVNEGPSLLRTTQSFLLLGAFLKTEYDMICACRPEKEAGQE